ncbi:MAG: HAD family phosphatase [Nanoarchaeota archaeon]
MKAVIFDMDGVLIDSLPIHLAIWPKIFARYGLPMFDAMKVNGMSTREICVQACRGTGVDPEALLRAKDAEEDKVTASILLMPGAKDCLQRLKAAFAVGMATSSTRDHVLRLDKNLHFLRHFNEWVTSSDVVKSKPAPDIYLLAAKRLGVFPVDCLVIEDAGNGIIAAKAAGMKCVALKNKYLDAAGAAKADYSVGSLHEITPALVSKLLKI